MDLNSPQGSDTSDLIVLCLSRNFRGVTWTVVFTLEKIQA